MTIPLVKLLVGTFALWAVVQYVVLPRMATGGPASVRRAALRSVLKFIRMLLFVATVTYAIVALVVVSVGVSATALESFAEWAERAHKALEASSTGWGLFTMVALLAAMLLASARLGGTAERARVRDHMETEWRRIDGQREHDELPELEPTPEMRSLFQQIHAIDLRLGEEHESPVSADQAAALESRRDELLREAYVRDTLRRIGPVPADEAEPRRDARETLRDQIGAVLGSRGMLAALQGPRKALGVASSVLLCLSLVGVTAVSAATTALHTKTVALHDLQIRRAAAKAEGAAEDVFPRRVSQQPRPLTPSESQAIRIIAHGFARRLEAVPPIRSAAVSPGAVADLDTAHVRDAILQTLHADARQGLSSVPSLDGGARGVARRIDDADVRDVVQERIASRLAQRMSHADPKASEAFLSRLAREFRAPAGMDEIRAAVTGQAFSAITDALAGHGDDVVAAQVKDLFGEAGGETLNAYFDLAFDEAVADERGLGFDRAIARMTSTGSDASRYGEQLFGAASQQYGDWVGWDRLVLETKAHPPSAPDQDVHVPAWASKSPPRGQSAFATTFADVAPAGFADDLRTAKARLDASLASAVPPPAIDAPVPPAAVEAVERGSIRGLSDEAAELAGGFIRGRNVMLLRGFSRIGGVLIGDPPRGDGSRPDCRALTWDRPKPGIVALHLSGPRCSATIEPLPAGLVASALAYAADGRPVATTMLQASPLLDMSVHLHPTLVDRPIGIDATKIDTFIDSYYRADSPPELYVRTEQRVTNDIALYHAALLGVLGAWAQKADEATLEQHPAILQSLGELEDVLSADLLTEALGEERSRAGGHARLAVLSAKPAYFDATVARIVGECLSAANAAGYFDCVKGAFARLNPSDKERLLAARRVEWRIESGVREAAFGIRDALRVDDDVTPGASRIGPFEFELHIAFASAPQFARSAADALAQDATPYRFPELEPGIVSAIRSNDDPSIQKVLRNMAAFTRTQRVFRLAMDGKLGDSFPKHRLLDLARSVRSADASTVHTARYLARPDAYVVTIDRYLAALSALSAGASPEEREAARGAASRLTRCASAAYARAWRTSRLVFDGAACDLAKGLRLPQPCKTRTCATVRYFAEFATTLRLRKDMQVANDDPRTVEAMQKECVLEPSSLFCRSRPG